MALFEQLAVRYMVDLIRDFTLEDFQAAGIIGNGGTESGGFTQIQEISPTAGQGGLGHFQWTGPRRRDFEAWLVRNEDKGWTAETYEANYSMLFRELVGPEAHAIPAVKATTTLEQATEAFMNKFERPGVPNLANRISWAKKALAAFHAAGSPVQAKLPPAPQILSPLPKFDPNTLAPIINALAPVLLQLLTARLQPATGAQQPPATDLAGMLAQLLGGLAPQPTIPPPPPPPVTIVTPEPKPKTSVGLGLLGLFGSAIGMATGQIGTPFGMGADPTTAGTLSVLIPAAISAVGATGIFGPWGAIAGRILGAVATAATVPKK